MQIQEALTGLSEELADLGKSLDMTEARTTRMQAKAYAIDRLVAEGLLEAADDRRGQSDLTLTPGIERQLQLLKREAEEDGDAGS